VGTATESKGTIKEASRLSGAVLTVTVTVNWTVREGSRLSGAVLTVTVTVNSTVREGSRLSGAKPIRMPKKGRRPARSSVLRRWLAVGALVLFALLYYRPLKAYVDARSELGHRSQVVHQLQADKQRLEQRLGSSTSPATLSREARALGYVRKGEHLFIVMGIHQWRARERASMMAPHGR
jgi:hypothetical protein